MSARSTSRASSHATLSIGEVLTQLRPDFPDVTISKIRFLEAEGLVEPERTSAGYRKFSHADVQRLRYVLTAQRDHYLPLRVIKDHLEAIDRGLEPAQQPGAGPRVPRALIATEGLPGPEAFGKDPSDVRLSRKELLEAAELDDATLAQLEQFQLVTTRPGSNHYDGTALTVAKTVSEMSRLASSRVTCGRSRRRPIARWVSSSRSSRHSCGNAIRRRAPEPRRSRANSRRCRCGCTRRW